MIILKEAKPLRVLAERVRSNMHITFHPICGAALGFELVNPYDLGMSQENKTYLTIELFIVRVVISFN
jgi:hypothetical protein